MAIITLIKQYANILIALIITSLTFYLASLYYNHKIDKINVDYTNYRVTTEKNILTQKSDILSQQNKLKEENLVLINKLKDNENENYKKYQSLQKSNNDLKSSISANATKLYINANCTKSNNSKGGEAEASNASSVDDGETSKAIIDTRDATAIIEITSKADLYKEQLESLQNWIKELIDTNNK